MAEIAFGVVGVAAAACALAEKLYQIGSTLTSASEEINCVARSLGNYSDVLDLLASRLEKDLAVSEKARTIFDRLRTDSENLFDDITEKLAKDNDDLTQLDRLKWLFNKPKTEFFVGQIESLKSTMNLLLNVLFVGKDVRSYRQTITPIDPRRPHDNQKYRNLSYQYLRTRNALRDYVYTSRQLSKFQEQARNSDAQSPTTQGVKERNETSQTPYAGSEYSQRSLTGRTLTASIDNAVFQPSIEHDSVVTDSDSMLHDLLTELAGLRIDCDKDNLLSQLKTSQIETSQLRTCQIKDPSPASNAQGFEAGRREGLEEGRRKGIGEGRGVGAQEGYEQGYAEGRQFSIQEGSEDCYEEGRKVGNQEGSAQGYEAGHQAGCTKGYAAGQQAGRRTGFDRGRISGIEEGKRSVQQVLVRDTLERGYTFGFEEGKNIGHREGFRSGYQQGQEGGFVRGQRWRPRAATPVQDTVLFFQTQTRETWVES